MRGCYIYCLYSTGDGVPRYVGRTTDKVSTRFSQHVTNALEKRPGPLYDWMRDVFRSDEDVGYHILQLGIVPADLDMFEQYWIDQFAGLLNTVGKRPRNQHSPVAQQVIAAIQRSLQPPVPQG